MSGALFDLRLADGRKLERVRIHGYMGEMGASYGFSLGTTAARRELTARLRGAILRAGEKRPLGDIFEPTPGCVRIYHGAWKGDLADETVEDVSIVGATVLWASAPEQS